MKDSQPPGDRDASVRELAAGLFRNSSGRLVATLARMFGAERLELAEDVAQEALLVALERWPYHGVPEDPYAWLVRVAKNLALDRLRRDASLRTKEPQVRAWSEESLAASAGSTKPVEDELSDDQLAMIFACCHPDLPADARVALTLKTVCGFGVSEIARAFLAQETTIAQRLVRAKNKLRDEHIAIAVPSGDEVGARLDSVLEVLYLVFNEGFCAHRGAELFRADLVRESIRLTAHLLRQPATAAPKVHALLALMLFQAARLGARTDESGSVLLLAEQDRSLWDRAMIARGFGHLQRAASGDELSDVHIEAAIASCHAMAASWSATDWPQILEYYDMLVARNASPIVALNRAVAVAMVEGPRAGLSALDAIEGLDGYYLRPALRGEFLFQLGELDQAALEFEHAVAAGCSEPELRMLQSKLADCGV